MYEFDANRLEAFRQMKKEIRGSRAYLIVGIDVGKERHTAFFGTPMGQALWKRLFFGNDREGFERLVRHAEAMRQQHDLSRVVFGLEPTANYHKPLGAYLIDGGELVVLVSNAAVKRNRGVIDGRWDKNDPKDAANVADLVSQARCLFYEHPPAALRDLRALLSLKRRLKRLEHSYGVRIRNHLVAQYFPELDDYMGYAEALPIVRWSLSPSSICAMGQEGFVRLVAPGKLRLAQQRRLGAIWRQATESIGCEATAGVSFEAEVLVEGLRRIREDLRSVNAKIKDVSESFEVYRYLLTIPGFGPDVSSKVLGAIGNPFRFRRGQEVLKMAGLDLSAERSGKRSHVTPVISKGGKAELRYALYQAALVASSRDRDWMRWFQQKLAGRHREKGIKTKMRVKLAAKFLIIAWSLMKKKEAYNRHYIH